MPGRGQTGDQRPGTQVSDSRDPPDQGTKPLSNTKHPGPQFPHLRNGGIGLHGPETHLGGTERNFEERQDV